LLSDALALLAALAPCAVVRVACASRPVRPRAGWFIGCCALAPAFWFCGMFTSY
jgi:hypothetical protein